MSDHKDPASGASQMSGNNPNHPSDSVVAMPTDEIAAGRRGMTRLLIDPDLEALIPPPEDEELRQLEENIRTEGCRDPLVVWDGTSPPTLIDGHHRYAICTRNGAEFRTVTRRFADKRLVMNWMINNQLGRRNITRIRRATFAASGTTRRRKRKGDRKRNWITLIQFLPPPPWRKSSRWGRPPSSATATSPRRWTRWPGSAARRPARRSCRAARGLTGRP
jgi:hypothetical protein